MCKRLIAALLMATAVTTSVSIPARAEEYVAEETTVDAEEATADAGFEEAEFIEEEVFDGDEEQSAESDEIAVYFADSEDVVTDDGIMNVDCDVVEFDLSESIDMSDADTSYEKVNINLDQPYTINTNRGVRFYFKVTGECLLTAEVQASYGSKIRESSNIEYISKAGNYYYYVYPVGVGYDKVTIRLNTAKGWSNYEGQFYYCNNGSVCRSYTGLAPYGGTYYYAKNGVFNKYTGLTKYDGKWYYVTNGILKWGVTGVTNYGGTFYFVNNSKVTFKDTGIAAYNGGYYYFKNSTFDPSYTGLASYNNEWYYVTNGVLKWGVTGCAQYGKTWYYVRNSKVDFNYTGYITYAGKKYYVKNGVVQG